MPRVDEGWVLVPLEKLAPPLGWAVECGCVLVDEPFTTVIESGGERLPVAVGSGSLLCPPECSDAPATGRLAVPAWARGVVLRSGPCPYTGDERLARLVEEAAGLELVEATRETVLGEGGLALAPRGLDMEPLGERCGALEPMLVTHPAAAVLAGRPHICLDEVLEPVRGGSWWGGVPVARLERGPVVIHRFNPLRGDRPEALLYTGVGSEKPLTLAYALGALHACGKRE